MIKKLIDSYERIRNVSRHGGDVKIFGAGQIGKDLHRELTKMNISISGFIDNDRHKHGKMLAGLPIEPLTAVEKGVLLFICVTVKSDDAYYSIRSDLERLGLEEGVDFGDFAINGGERFYQDAVPVMDVPADTYDLRYKCLKYALSAYPEYTVPDIDVKTVVMPGLDLKVTNVCNLKCPYCAHVIPQITGQRRHFNAEQIVDDLNKLLEVCYTPYVCLIGGEPLLHPQFLEIVERLAEMPNISHTASFLIITNGTIVPNDDILKAYAKLPYCVININGHSDRLQSVNELIDKCGHYKIGVNPPDKASLVAWSDIGNIHESRRRTPRELRHLFAVCKSGASLCDGVLYKCYNAPSFAEAGVDVCTDDYVDIRGWELSPPQLSETLWEYLYVKPYLSVCDRCDGIACGSKEVRPGDYRIEGLA